MDPSPGHCGGRPKAKRCRDGASALADPHTDGSATAEPSSISDYVRVARTRGTDNTCRLPRSRLAAAVRRPDRYYQRPALPLGESAAHPRRTGTYAGDPVKYLRDMPVIGRQAEVPMATCLAITTGTCGVVV
ncbi:MAG: hypothetical protein LC808_13570, partial [Actinobacteria bacterium]|nr:hypothetical protein [Actinomycetota bacterium]